MVFKKMRISIIATVNKILLLFVIFMIHITTIIYYLYL